MPLSIEQSYISALIVHHDLIVIFISVAVATSVSSLLTDLRSVFSIVQSH